MEEKEKKREKRRKILLWVGLGIVVTGGSFVSGYMAGRLNALPEQKEENTLRAENAVLKAANARLEKSLRRAEYYHGKSAEKLSSILETARS